MAENAIRDYRKDAPRAYTFTLKNLRKDLQRLKLDDHLVYALQVTDMKLRIELDLDSNPFVTLHDKATGNRIGSITDLERIAKLSEIVKEGKKILQSSDILQDMEKYLVSYVQTLEDAEFEKFKRMGKIDPLSVGRLKQILPKLKMLDANEAFIKKTLHSADEDICQISAMVVSWIRLAYDVLLAEIHDIFITSGARFSKKAELYKLNLPEWGYNKVTQALLSTQTDVRRIIFSQTLKTSFSLSIREWLNPQLVSDHKWLLRYSGAFQRFFNSESLMKAYLHKDFSFKSKSFEILKDGTKLPTYNLENKAKAALDELVPVVPLYFSANFTFAPHATGKSSRLNPKVKLAYDDVRLATDHPIFSLLTTYIRSVTFNVPVLHSKVNFWTPLFKPRGVSVDFLEDSNNIFESMLVGKPSKNLLDSIHGFYSSAELPYRKLLVDTMNYELQLPSNSKVLGDIREWLCANSSSTVHGKGKKRNAGDFGSSYRKDYEGKVIEVSTTTGFDILKVKQVSDAAQEELVRHVRNRISEPETKMMKKAKKEGFKPKLNRASDKSKAILEEVATIPYMKGLSSHLEDWLTEFSPGRIQEAAVIHLRNFVEGLKDAIENDRIDIPVYKLAEKVQEQDDWGDEFDDLPQIERTPESNDLGELDEETFDTSL